MKINDFFAAVKVLGLTQSKDIPTVFFDRQGKPRNVKDPSKMTEAEREVFIRALRWLTTGEGSPPYV